MAEDADEPGSVGNTPAGEPIARMSLGPEIRRLRDRLGMTLGRLSALTGIREAYLSAIEDGREEPSARALRRIAEHLGPAGTTYADLERLLASPEFDRAGEYGSAASVAAHAVGARGDGKSDRDRATPDLPAPPPTEMQFDRAEVGQGGPMGCAACRQPLSGSYFDVNGQTVCDSCGQQLRERSDAGSPWSRACRAAGAGFAAAVAGTVLYFAILAMTGFEFGLVAVVVGYMVGKAVNWGSYGRGGWRYQALAMVLTYLSIVASYVPVMIKAFAENRSTVTDTRALDGRTETVAATPSHVRTEEALSPPTRPEHISLRGWLVAIAMLILLTCALPFLAGISNSMGIVIIGIGVYEAWKFNRRPAMVITGPHTLGPSLQAPAQV